MSRVFTITEGLENLGALKTGGQGSIYRAKRIGPIITAVKLLPTPITSEDLSDKNYRDFRNEVEKLKKVNELPNPNVVRILNYGISETGSFPFIEMEFIEGPDLEESLKPPHDPVFTVKETVRVAEHLANALAHCHRVDVKHGDIKSNNVKFNVHTGNYVLLDFGLALMSDEQRRTSLRHAGAVEFMAPEQSEGKLLFQSDVYSYGVILYELLAGQVPFPLENKNETTRNKVLLAHLETPPPDILPLRGMHLPDAWPEERREHEMCVPQWLLDMIRRCLEKDPEQRFVNGVELYEYILRNSTVTAESSDLTEMLRQENKRLQEENALLQQQMHKADPESVYAPQQPQSVNFPPAYAAPVKSNNTLRRAIPIGLAALAAIVALFLVLRTNNQANSSAAPVAPADTTTEIVANPSEQATVPQPKTEEEPVVNTAGTMSDTSYVRERSRRDTITERRQTREEPQTEEQTKPQEEPPQQDINQREETAPVRQAPDTSMQ